MSSKTRIQISTILWAITWFFAPFHGLSQSFIDQWADQTLERMDRADFVSFNEANPRWYNSEAKPNIKDSIPELDALEIALLPWGEDPSLENRCVQLLLEGNMLRLQLLHVMKGLYGSDIIRGLHEANLHTSLQWIPILASSYNHSARFDSEHVGLWGLSKEQAQKMDVLIDNTVDDRMLPQVSTAASIQLLDRLQRRFPENPERVLVGFIKGMPFASRWSGLPGYDPYIDEWLALYRVVARFMVNLEAQDFEPNWGVFLTTWKPILCTKNVNRGEIQAQAKIPQKVQFQFLPWWQGSVLTCSIFEEYQPYLPEEWALKWNTHFSEQRAENLPEKETGDDSNPIIGYQPDSSTLPAKSNCIEYRVKKGDTLYNIAQRFPGTTPENIALENSVTSLIKIGQVLCIPGQE